MTDAIFHLKRLAGLKGCEVNVQALRPVLRVYAFQPAFARFLLQRSANEVKPGLVDVIAKLVCPGFPDQDGGRIGHTAETDLAFAQSLLSPLILRDIPRDLGGTDDLSRAVFDGGNAQRDINLPAILGDPYRLVVFDPLAPSQLCQDAGFLLLQFSGDEQKDRLADGFLSGVTEDALGPGIPGGDDAFQGFADDGVIGGFHHGGDVGESHLVFTQHPFETRPFDEGPDAGNRIFQ